MAERSHGLEAATNGQVALGPRTIMLDTTTEVRTSFVVWCASWHGMAPRQRPAHGKAYEILQIRKQYFGWVRYQEKRMGEYFFLALLENGSNEIVPNHSNDICVC